MSKSTERTGSNRAEGNCNRLMASVRASEALSIVAYGLDWRNGDNVVGIAQEFPSNRILWESLGSQGVEYRRLDLYASAVPEDDLMGLCDERTRLMAVSSVQYARGLLLDLERLSGLCRARGILLCVDGIQSLGAVPFDLARIHADFVAADGHKWMLGPEGLFIDRKAALVERLCLTVATLHPEHLGEVVECSGDFRVVGAELFLGQCHNQDL